MSRGKKLPEEWAKCGEAKNREYFVSNWGNCKTVNRTTGQQKITKGYLIKQLGYYRFCDQYVHRLVLTHFFRPALPGEECDHVSGVRVNNYIKNLRWTTKRMNQRRISKRRLCRKNYRCIKHPGEVIRGEKDGVVKFWSNGMQAANDISCSHVLVYNVLNKRLSAVLAKGWTLRWVRIEDVQSVSKPEGCKSYAWHTCPVQMYRNGVLVREFQSQTEAANELGITQAYVSLAIRDKMAIRGYTFTKKTNEE